jgi:hypothetical protein
MQKRNANKNSREPEEKEREGNVPAAVGNHQISIY